MEINKFSIPETCITALIIGKRSTGKTRLIQDLIVKQELDIHLAINHIATEYKDYTNNVFTEYDISIIDKFIKESHINSKQCVVFDNCIYLPKWLENNSVCNLFMKKINIFLSMSYPLSIPEILDDRINYIFLFKDSNMSNKRLIYNKYCSKFITLYKFFELFDEITSDDHKCLVINKFARSYNELFMWYKAEPLWKTMVNKKNKWLDVIREELIQKTWHPSRMINCLDCEELKVYNSLI